MYYLKHLPIALLTLLLASPLFVLVMTFFLPEQGQVFYRIVTQQLPDYIFNTATLLVGVLCLTGWFGAYTAWCISRYRFRSRRLLDVLLMLPLAVPSYINAMVYGRLLDVAGPVQQWLGAGMVPNIHSLGGVIFVLSLSLFPYVYMAMRVAFSVDMTRSLEAAQMLGVSERSLLWRIALPAARPAFIAGLSLVAMETLAEFGASSLYGVQTFTTGIYHAWYEQFSPLAAARLSMVLVVIVLLALRLEKRLRNNAHYHHGGAGANHGDTNLTDHAAPFFGKIICATPCVLGVMIPLMQLLYWASLSSQKLLDAPTLMALKISLMVAGYVALAAVFIAMIYAYLERRYANHLLALMAIRVATLGYAIPGTVIAVALFIPLLALEQAVDMPMLFTGSLLAMVMACVIRFLAVAYHMIQPALMTIPKRNDEAAHMLGASPVQIVRRLHLPQMRPALMIGVIVVMVDTLRELPASLMLRPFDTSTLAIRTYELAVDGRLVAASHPALWMIMISAAVMLALKMMQHYAMKKGRA